VLKIDLFWNLGGLLLFSPCQNTAFLLQTSCAWNCPKTSPQCGVNYNEN
jgi:hypothetical protein